MFGETVAQSPLLPKITHGALGMNDNRAWGAQFWMGSPALLADIFVSRAVSIHSFLSKDKTDNDVITSVNQTLEDTWRANRTLNIDPNFYESILDPYGTRPLQA